MSTAEQPARQPQILAIDDEPEILNILDLLLTGEGYRVLTAPAAAEGVDLYERLWPDIDLVLLDFLMPEMTGDIVFEHLQRINPAVRALLLTACDSPVAARMLERGLRGYIQKPFYLEDLLARVREQLAQQEEAQP